MGKRIGKDHSDLFIVDTVGEQRGMHYYNFPLANKLCDLGFEIAIISTPETIAHPLFPAKLNAFGIFNGIYGERPKLIRGINYIWALIKLCRLCIEKKPRIIHFHFFQIPLLDFVLIQLLELIDTNIVISVHDVVPISNNGSDNFHKYRMFRNIYRKSTRLIVHTQYTKEILHDFEPSLVDRTTVIPHANYSFFINQIHPQDYVESGVGKAQIGVPPQAKVLLVFGTIKQNKRLDWIITALSYLKEKHPDLHLIIAGRPQNRDISTDMILAENLQVSDRVHWRIDKASDDELVRYFTCADIALFPYESIYQSGAIIMALNFAKPVIATAVGSNPEIITNHKTGLLVDTNDPMAFANAISSLVENPVKAAKLGKAGFDFVTQELSWEAISGKYADLYRSISFID